MRISDWSSDVCSSDLVALALLGTVMGAGARADTAVFAAFGAVIAAILGIRIRRINWIAVGTVALIILVSAGFYLSSGQADAVVSGLTPQSPPPPLPITQHVTNFLEIGRAHV